jgi:hypothetical protein
MVCALTNAVNNNPTAKNINTFNRITSLILDIKEIYKPYISLTLSNPNFTNIP